MDTIRNLTLITIFSLSVWGCATAQMYSSERLKTSSAEELKKANDLVEDAKSKYNLYAGAHKHMIASESLGDRDKMRKLHETMKSVRVKAKSIFAVRKQVRKDAETLQQELGEKEAIAEGSDTFNRVSDQVALYGHGKPHPEIEKLQQEFKADMEQYTQLLSEYSGYLTDTAGLKSQFQKKLASVRGRLEKLSEKAQGDPAKQAEASKIQSKVSDIETSFASELPKTSAKMLLFPNMVSFSVIDKLSDLEEQIDEMLSPTADQ